MKTFTLFPLQSYSSKIVGLFITAFSIILLVVIKLLKFTISGFTVNQLTQTFSLALIVGLFITSFSKEKLDDERVRSIRAKAFQAGFGVLVVIMISLIFVSIIFPYFSLNTTDNLSLIVSIGLLIYLSIFNIGLYLDPQAIHNNGTVSTNLRGNQLLFCIYLVILASMISLLFI